MRPAARLLELEAVLARLAGEGLARHCRLAFGGADVLVIFADHPAFAARLRQVTPRLVAGFNKAGQQVSAIQVRVQVAGTEVPAVVTAPALGPLAQESLGELAARVSYGPLRSALQRLQRRGHGR